MSPTVYLVSGANRGIGLGLVIQLAARDDVVVFAGTRNPSSAKDLQTLVRKYPGKFHIVKLVSGDKAGNEAVVAEIKQLAGKLDVVIANAGIFHHAGPVLETPLDTMREHFEVNVVGTLALFQATYPLLSASSSPKFVPISSIGGSITDGASTPFGITAYGTSKAGENYLARKIHAEYPNLVCFPIHPGSVNTDMAVDALKYDKSLEVLTMITVEESVTGILTQVDKATRETASGRYLSYTGETLNW